MKSKAFIVTGADGEVGRAWAAAHIANGARVALVGTDYSACRLAAGQLGGRAVALDADVTTAAGWLHAVRATLAMFGRIDDVYNDGSIHDPACETDAAPPQSGARNGVRVPRRFDIVGPGELESAPHPNPII
ncbi:SDR family NAD(P)-dependent oxidoreductase [Duganella sp. HH101]|uniref:SDR family NAD(P)-dependent oxidoreductase n=1 Tax=Duganella sp. HH101 TaxID=1781066 RepID=UPI000874B6BE|nr:SDR family NAD(P)-dependent oxidoreductase [Duganella sp. HH101]OFA02087.1 sorbitol dehydrogenase [Duganella sp. HH101]